MNAFKTHRGLIVPLDRSNVDTDQIIAKQFLKSIARTGFGPHLFHDWRYKPDGSLNPEFPLNDPKYKGSSILVAKNNFGCGSSREHAVWAIHQYGFQVVIAPWQQRGSERVPGFADIFRNNSFKNSLLTIELSESEVNKIFEMAAKYPGLQGTANLLDQKFTLHTPEEISFPFEIDAATKDRMVNGLDDIGIALKEEAAIKSFETKHSTQI
jgi:3-isopropylmalate/(R)-2-methylmalate dehydratase small subunit